MNIALFQRALMNQNEVYKQLLNSGMKVPVGFSRRLEVKNRLISLSDGNRMQRLYSSQTRRGLTLVRNLFTGSVHKAYYHRNSQ